jgi:hypothetical protein
MWAEGGKKKAEGKKQKAEIRKRRTLASWQAAVSGNHWVKS